MHLPYRKTGTTDESIHVNVFLTEIYRLRLIREKWEQLDNIGDCIIEVIWTD